MVRPVCAEVGRDRRSEGCVLLPLASAWTVALHEVDGVLVEIEAHIYLTAVVTTTSSTGLPSGATQRTPPAHVAWSDQGPARIC